MVRANPGNPSATRRDLGPCYGGHDRRRQRASRGRRSGTPSAAGHEDQATGQPCLRQRRDTGRRRSGTIAKRPSGTLEQIRTHSRASSSEPAPCAAADLGARYRGAHREPRPHTMRHHSTTVSLQRPNAERASLIMTSALESQTPHCLRFTSLPARTNSAEVYEPVQSPGAELQRGHRNPLVHAVEESREI